MARKKFGVALSGDIVDELEKVVDECADLGASRSEIVEAVLTAYFKSNLDHVARVRELVLRRREGNL